PPRGPSCENARPMSRLRRVLYWQAALWVFCGVGIAAVPRWALSTLFDQPVYPDYSYVPISGAMSVGLALFLVFVAQPIEELWWWSWTFALVDAAIITITALNAVFGSSPALLWWIFSGATALLLVGTLSGMARAGEEKPLV